MTEDHRLPPRGHQCFMSEDHRKEFYLLCFRTAALDHFQADRAWDLLRKAWFALPECPTEEKGGA